MTTEANPEGSPQDPDNEEDDEDDCALPDNVMRLRKEFLE